MTILTTTQQTDIPGAYRGSLTAIAYTNKIGVPNVSLFTDPDAAESYLTGLNLEDRGTEEVRVLTRYDNVNEIFARRLDDYVSTIKKRVGMQIPDRIELSDFLRSA